MGQPDTIDMLEVVNTLWKVAAALERIAAAVEKIEERDRARTRVAAGVRDEGVLKVLQR